MERLTEVRKRDNRIVPFDRSKISDAIYKAVRAVGAGDKGLADELAAAVTMFLEKKFAGSIPGIEDIQDMVETVLTQTGHEEIAAVYVEYRRKRAKIREILQVHKETPDGPAVQTESRGIEEPWSKSKIVAALVKEADLETQVAEEVASSVEAKVLKSELRRISTSLLRELVDNELFERGYAAKLKKQASVGFPKYNLEQVILSSDTKEPYSFVKDPTDVNNIIAEHILGQYSLEHLHSPEVAAAARDGRIILHNLGSPLSLHRVSLAGTEQAFSEKGLKLPFCRLHRAVAGTVSVPFPDRAEILRELGLLSGAGGRSVAVSATREYPFLNAPAPEGPESLLRYILYLDPHLPLQENLVNQAAAYYIRGFHVSFLVGKPPGRFIAPAKVSLNLPQLALRSGRTRLGDLIGEIDRALSVALKWHLERKSFIKRLSHAPDLPLWEILGSGEGRFGDIEEMVFPVGLFGLADAVKFVSGKEVFQETSSFSLAKQAIEHLAEKTEREARGLGINLRLEETTEGSVLTERLRRDRLVYPEVKEIFRGRPKQASYTPGVRLPSDAPFDPLAKTEYLSTLFHWIALDDIVEDDGGLRSSGEEVLRSLIAESIRLFAPSGEPAT